MSYDLADNLSLANSYKDRGGLVDSFLFIESNHVLSIPDLLASIRWRRRILAFLDTRQTEV
jgi:hypothetical protein